jgi:CDP-glucose 4,6-dehydratase
MKWKPVWDMQQTMQKTIHWYKHFYNEKEVNSYADLEAYVSDAQKNNCIWVS